jgi:hypothetical protein
VRAAGGEDDAPAGQLQEEEDVRVVGRQKDDVESGRSLKHVVQAR